MVRSLLELLLVFSATQRRGARAKENDLTISTLRDLCRFYMYM